MSFLLGSFSAKLGIDTNDYASGILKAQGVTELFGKTFGTFLTNPLLGAGQLFKRAGGAALDYARDALGAAEANERLAQTTGFSTETLQAMERALLRAGYGGEIAAQSSKKFVAVLGEARAGAGPLVPILEQLGISITSLGDSESSFRRILDAIDRYEDPAVRAALAAKVFGEEAGAKLISALGGGSDALDEQIRLYTKLGLVVDGDTTAALAKMNTTSGQVQDALEGIKRSAIISFMQGFSNETSLSDEKIADMAKSVRDDLSPAFRQLGDDVATVVKFLKDIRNEEAGLSDAAKGITNYLLIEPASRLLTGEHFNGTREARRASRLSPQEFEDYFEAERQKRLRR